MREIKFRAWSENNRYMHFDIGPFDDQCGECSRELILMQFTGLRDKNGKEIYEGDVVVGKPTYPDFREVIKWRSELHDDSDLHTGFTHGIEAKEMTVVGNIWEHPDLLPDAQKRGE